MDMKAVIMHSTNRKNISISSETHAELNKIGVRGESFDDIIRKCIEAYKKVHKRNG
jgi:predicted CopG family antitoxin